MYSSFGRYCDGLFNFGRFNYGGIIMMIFGLLLVGAVIYFLWKGNRNSFQTESPQDLLKKRYVNGEISEEEFKLKKETLGK